MKFNEMVDQIHSLAVDGEINGKKLTKKELVRLITDAMPHSDQMTKMMATIRLRDGCWHFQVTRWLPAGTRFFEFDYAIPDTREQETAMIRRFHGLPAN